MSTADELIHQLQETIRLLTLENDQLAERAEDTLLLGLIGEKINADDQDEQVLEIALEQISILKNIAASLCCTLEPEQVLVRKSFVSFSPDDWDGRKIALQPALAAALEGSAGLLAPDECQALGLFGLFEAAVLGPGPALCVPYKLHEGRQGFFLFIGGMEGSRVEDALPLLERAVEMIVTRLDNLFLLRNLQELNDHLDKKVEARTQAIIQSNQQLQQEIIERQRAEQALRESEERLRKAQAIAQVGNWEIDLAAQTMWGSEEAFRVYGLERTNPELPVVAAQRCVLPAYRAGLDRALEQLLAGVKDYDEEFQICRPSDGDIRFVHSRAELVVDSANRPLKVRGVIQDITQSKLAQAEIEHRLAELEAVNLISKALRVAQSFDEMLPSLLDETLAVLGTDSGDIWLYNPDDNRLYPQEARGWFTRLAEAPIQPGEGVVGHVYVTNQAYVTNEFAGDPLTHAAARLQVPKGWGGAAIPIRTQDQVGGVLLVSVRMPRRLRPNEVHLLSTLAEIAGNAMHRMRLHDQTEQRLRRLTALRSIDDAIRNSLDLQLTLNVMLEQIMTQLNVDAANILLFNPAISRLEYAAGRGFRGQGIEHTQLHLGEGNAGKAAIEHRTIFANLTQPDGDFMRTQQLAEEQFVAYFGVPLVAKERITGVLEIFHRSPLERDAEWVEFMETLAGQATIAIENATLFDNLQCSNAELAAAYDATIEGWSRALDLRDKETEGHTQRVTEITVRAARSFGLNDAELAQVRWGALLHDIGKMGVPDRILLKPGPLTDAEWAVMRQHPVFAYEMLSPIHYLRSAIDIPYCHHEKWDGSGYPRGLKGEEIPSSARIFAVVDVWDALRSDRPYRNAWSEERVVAYLRSLAGSHFDPQALEVCLQSHILTAE